MKDLGSREPELSRVKKLFLALIVLFSRVLILILKTTKRGSGTALPGFLVDRYFPFAFNALIAQIPTIVVITGTNGKTTTQAMVSSILNQVEDIKVLHNRAGANLKQGLLSQLLLHANLYGELNVTHGIFEVEEATLPRIVKVLRPDIIAVTNLYRDQLDAYGEVDITEQLIQDSIVQCPTAQVVVNGDDPRSSRLTKGLKNQTYFTSLPALYSENIPYEGCLQNTASVTHNILRATQWYVHPDLHTDIEVQGEIDRVKVESLRVSVASPGLFHIYNALTAIAISKLLGVGDRSIIQGLESFKPVFGRGEVLAKEYQGKRVYYRVLLVKNPASFSLTLDLLKQLKALKFILAINDNVADGRDVSWLWDSNLEILNGADIDWIVCTGTRAKDMKLRLKYAFNSSNTSHEVDRIGVEESIRRAIELSFMQAADGDTIYVLPNYTAMLEFRKAMGKYM